MVERLVGELPGTCSLGEVVHLWERALRDDELCSCGRPFSRCPFWTEVGARAFGGWDRLDAGEVLRLKGDVDRNRHLPWLLLGARGRRRRSALRQYLRLYEALYRSAAEVSGADVVVDSSKHASLVYALRWSSALDLRVVHMVRDARAVAYSWSRRRRRPEAGDPSTMMPRWGPVRVSLWWDAFASAFLLLPLTGTPVRVVRYEDVMAAPTRELLRIADHARLSVEEEDMAFLRHHEVDLSPSHAVAGNPMRFTVGTVPLRRDDEWRGRMPATARRITSVMTTPLRLPLGYIRPSAGAVTRRPRRGDR
ncbi:sulfotransferase domain-containing protein [Pseudokineococcus basanitobsidens]|uniref:Sulfotransferase domain-containing protein n=1 Tax=Pseudokineococcus basanitobsidens TaxID=1926649 RepID=A0ABU8RMM1_9ACTN